MATNWTFIPYIGFPMSLKNGLGEDVPQEVLIAGKRGSPRQNTLKTFFGLRSLDPSAIGEDEIIVSVHATRIYTLNDVINLDGSKGINDIYPIVIIVPENSNGAPSQVFIDDVLFNSQETTLVTIKLKLAIAPPTPVNFGVCIDFSHSIVN